jgi:hypothetical protein
VNGKGRGSNNGSKWIRPARRLAIYARDGFACVYCGASGDGPTPVLLTLDHWVAGLNHSNGNLLTACRPCNSGKQNFPNRQWYKVLRSWGIDTKGLLARVRRHLARPVNVALGKRLLAARAPRPAPLAPLLVVAESGVPEAVPLGNSAGQVAARSSSETAGD